MHALHEDSAVAPHAEENVPTVHKTHDADVAAPEVVEMDPGWHREQAEEAINAEYVPAPQARQLVDPCPVEYVPARQNEQHERSVKPWPVEYVPT